MQEDNNVILQYPTLCGEISQKEMNNLYDDYRREYIKSRFEGFINDFKEIIKDVENKFNLITDFHYKRNGNILPFKRTCYI